MAERSVIRSFRIDHFNFCNNFLSRQILKSFLHKRFKRQDFTLEIKEVHFRVHFEAVVRWYFLISTNEYICKSNETGRWPRTNATTRWHGPLAILDPEDIGLICKSERYGFCIESSDRIAKDTMPRNDAILFLSFSLSLCVWLARFRARWNLEMAACYI